MKNKTTKTITEKGFYTIGDLAKLFGVHHDTIRRWDRKGKIKSFRVIPNGRRLFRKDYVDKLIKSNGN